MQLMVQQVTLKFTGTGPLLQHNQRLADPLDPWSKKMKAVTGKRKKTDADHEEMARIEWEGGMYYNDDGPYIPSGMVIASLRDAGKLTRQGSAVTRAVTVLKDECRLDYLGPRSLEAMFADPNTFVDRRSVGVGASRVMRTRPKFPLGWSFECPVAVDEKVLAIDQLEEIGQQGGQLIGMGDFRQLYGRYNLEVHKP